MKKIFVTFIFMCAVWSLQAQTLQSPDGNLQLRFELNSGVPQYSLNYKNKPVVKPSKLGFEIEKGESMLDNFKIEKTEQNSFDQTWKPVLGEVSEIRNQYNELAVTLAQGEKQREIKIVFRLFNDGLGFRYEFPKQKNLEYFSIANERTEFAMNGDHTAFWIPGNFDSQEYYYSKTPISQIDASKANGKSIGTHNYFAVNSLQTPVLFKTNDGLYISVFEAALIDYPAMALLVDRQNFVFTSALAPSAVGTKAFMQTPCKTPWRTVLVSDKAADIVATKTILNLNEPCKIKNTDWIKPCKYVGIWWEMHIPGTPKHTWSYANGGNIKLADTDWKNLKPSGRHSANTENTKRYIDFAAANGFDAVLVEGWNVGWEDWSGKWKEEVFDFVTPYPDFDVAEIERYAKSKGVKMIMHHETSASVTNYERRIDEAFNFMKAHNYNSVKTGYVGWIIPRGEKHDGQWMVNHYNRVLQKAAAKQIMVDAHEPVRPTGISRTYPNLLACEAARGNEYNAWSDGNPPEHETILPFTRLLGGAMDYTPGIFQIKMNVYNPKSTYQVHTTLAKQLALYVTLYSPLQMAADLPENYEKHMDAFQFIKDVDVDWVDTRVLEAEPGDYLTIARKGKYKNAWFVGSITDENARTAEIKMDFLEPGKKYVATNYADAPDADWQNNPQAYKIETKNITSKTILKQKIAPGGGCAITIKEK